MVVRRSLVCVTALAMLMCAVPASAEIAVWLEPASPTVDVGEFVDVDLMASFDEPVVAWGLDLTIAEPTYADWAGMLLGLDWDAPGGTLDGDGLAGLRLDPGVTGEVLLATLTFEGLAEGETFLSLSSGPEEDEGILLEAGGMATGVQFTGATLTVVPGAG